MSKHTQKAIMGMGHKGNLHLDKILYGVPKMVSHKDQTYVFLASLLISMFRLYTVFLWEVIKLPFPYSHKNNHKPSLWILKQDIKLN